MWFDGEAPPRAARLATTLVVLALAVGCSNRPPRVSAPRWSPGSIAEQAVRQLDKSGDGQIDNQEALEAPGLSQAFDDIDSDGDGRLTAAEVQARLKLYDELGTALVRQSVEIRIDERPVPGLYIKFIPESFQGDILRPAAGTTNDRGVVTPQTEGAEFLAMQPGFFRVELYRDQSASSPIAVEVPLGVEVNPQVRSGSNATPVLAFKRR